MLYNQQKTDKRFKERGKVELSSSFLRRYGDLEYVLNCRHNFFVCGSRPRQNFHWFLNMKHFIKTKEAGFGLDTFYKQQFSQLAGLRPVMRCQHCSQSSPLHSVCQWHTVSHWLQWWRVRLWGKWLQSVNAGCSHFGTIVWFHDKNIVWFQERRVCYSRTIQAGQDREERLNTGAKKTIHQHSCPAWQER